MISNLMELRHPRKSHGILSDQDIQSHYDAAIERSIWLIKCYRMPSNEMIILRVGSRYSWVGSMSGFGKLPALDEGRREVSLLPKIESEKRCVCLPLPLRSKPRLAKAFRPNRFVSLVFERHDAMPIRHADRRAAPRKIDHRIGFELDG